MHEDRVVTYGSRKLKDHDHSYLTHDLELATMMFVLKQ